MNDVLDIGCGDGRFGRFLSSARSDSRYTGIDFSTELLHLAGSMPGMFLTRDFSEPGSLEGLGEYDLVVCLATLQHLPGRENRVRLLTEVRHHLAEGGRLIVSTWQFLDSERQRRKIRPWRSLGLSERDVDAGDFLLSWQRDGFGLRYVAYLDGNAMAALATEAGLAIIQDFRCDGREGDLNLYTVMAG